jgi:alpha-L-fucosidase 2
VNNKAAALVAALQSFAADPPQTYEIWESAPAPNRGQSQWEETRDSRRPNSYDLDWERWSYPLGNGYVGACVFGRTDTERIQITDKTVHNRGIYKRGGLTSFAEVYLDFDQGEVADYRRSLSLNDAIAHVAYTHDGVTYKREYLASYPDNVIVIRLTASQAGALSFRVRPEIPYLEMKERTGSVRAAGNLLTLTGTMPHFSCNFEGQILVQNEGGAVMAGEGTLDVSKADAVTLLIATGSNYRLRPDTFSKPPAEKLDPDQIPHDEVSARIQAAQTMGYAALRERHLKDYQDLFNRVSVDLNSTPSTDPTHPLLETYKQGEGGAWLEELMFQYGRYLLIASSRENSLPANLQGTWSNAYHTPWSGGYWHNINVQMNYWGAMSTNLSECFEAYTAYFNAYLPTARQHAANYVRRHNPDRLTADGDNGWIIGTGANAYHVPGAGGHSGPGTGGFTAKLLVDYYLFTQDREFLEQVAYPAMLSLSRFYAKALVPQGELLLVEPSASPEQKSTPKQVEGMPGHRMPNGYYITAGCNFDQGFVWESFHDTLALADALGKEDPFLDTIRDQIRRLDPVQVGADGQIKEFREETHYSDIGEPQHRHISHLCPLYPGTLIDSDRADWMQAASKTLDLRGNRTTGWALAHRMNCRARLGEGEKAHEVYRHFIRTRTLPNLWTEHPPFQIDGSLGTMAGVAEMLLQSHEPYMKILPALPSAWSNGHFDGLVARGNFGVSATWTDGRATAISILSRSGGECRIAYPGIGSATVSDSDGNTVDVSRDGADRIRFVTRTGARYAVETR